MAKKTVSERPRLSSEEVGDIVAAVLKQHFDLKVLPVQLKHSIRFALVEAIELALTRQGVKHEQH